MANKTKTEIMTEVLNDIRSQYKTVSIGYYNDIGKNMDVETISTDSVVADWVLGGGISRMTEILGLPSAGKTTLAFTAIAKAQREDPDFQCLYVDSEYAVDPRYARALGVDMERVVWLQPDSSTEGYNLIESVIKSGVCDLVVLDSIAAMIPPEYTEKSVGEEVKIASFARLTTQAISRINRLSSQYNTNVLFINQYKDAVSMGPTSGGSGTVMGNSSKYAPGGPSKDFFFHQILEMKRKSQIKDAEGNVVTNVYQIKTLKNKIAPPYRMGDIAITFGKGLDIVQEIVGVCLAKNKFIIQHGGRYEVLDKDGTPLTLDGKTISGRQGVVDFLTENPDILEKIKGLVRDELNNSASEETSIDNVTGTGDDINE